MRKQNKAKQYREKLRKVTEKKLKERKGIDSDWNRIIGYFDETAKEERIKYIEKLKERLKPEKRVT